MKSTEVQTSPMLALYQVPNC